MGIGFAQQEMTYAFATIEKDVKASLICRAYGWPMLENMVLWVKDATRTCICMAKKGRHRSRQLMGTDQRTEANSSNQIHSFTSQFEASGQRRDIPTML